MKPLVILFLTITLVGGVQAQAGNKGHVGYVPKEGFVPDERTAVAIARAVLLPIFGEATIKQEEPLQGSLLRGVWTVKGTMPKAYEVGGVAVIKIRKQDGQILFVIHGK